MNSSPENVSLMKQKYLQKNQIEMVHPRLQKMVRTAWANGEKVPFSVTLITFEKPLKWASGRDKLIDDLEELAMVTKKKWARRKQ